MSETKEKQSRLIETQIESMLQRVMSEDKEEGNLHFSDNNSDIENHNDLKEINEESSPNDSYIRNSRKHQTFSFVPNSFLTTLSSYQSPPLMLDPHIFINQYPIYQPLPYIYNQPHYPPIQYLPPQNFQRSNIRGCKAYENDPNQTFKFRTAQMENNPPITLFPKCSNEAKKFGTTALPHGTNMKIEILLHEITASLIKSDKIDQFIFNKVQGSFVSIIKTHKGSKVFQDYLKNTHSDIIHQIFAEVNTCLVHLMKDPYANYFCKKIFCFLNQKDKTEFLIIIKDSLYDLAINSIGTYPIQGIIEQVGSKTEKKIIMTEFNDRISDLCYDTYGTHVLEKILCCFEDEFVGIIYDFTVNNFLNLAYHNNGINIVKTILTLTHKKDVVDKMRLIIKDNAQEIIQHPYGNHVIKIIIEYWEERESKDILDLFNKHFSYFSMQKYSSNVVEKRIEKSVEALNIFIQEICESNKISDIMKNAYGNYVIQKALLLIEGPNKPLLLNQICQNIHKLGDKKLIQKWKSIVFPHLDQDSYDYLDQIGKE